MANRNLLRQFDDNLDAEILLAFGDQSDNLDSWLPEESQVFESNKIVHGKVLEIRGEDVVIDIGYKSEGVIRLEEWREEDGTTNAPKPGDTIEVLLETVEDENGTISLSYRKAKRQKEWRRSSPSTRKAMS